MTSKRETPALIGTSTRSATPARTMVCSLMYVGLALSAIAASTAAESFTGSTLRLDFFHTGTAQEEHISVDRVRREGPWPGHPDRHIDTLAYGKYFFEIIATESGETLYSRGFASLYGEWETTAEANDGTVKTFPEALRFPEPVAAFEVRLSKRGTEQAFHEIWKTTIDPQSRFVDKSAVNPQEVWTVFENGKPEDKVDLLFLGDGYAATEMDKFHADVERLADALFRHQPFMKRKSDFNVRAIDTPSAESGVSRPRSAVFRESPLGLRYNTFDSERYLMSVADRDWRDIAAAAPYEFVILLANSDKYGGGGIYSLYATAAADSGFADYVMVHEFGHHFAGLGDEYYTSDVAYENFFGEQIEPWEANLTALTDSQNLKWGDLVSADTPLPTPWNKEDYEVASRAIQQRRKDLRAAEAPESALEALFSEERTEMTKRLGNEAFAGRVGAFEGGGYQAQGIYRPSADCIMFTRDEVGFCAVCARAIEAVIDLYVGY